MVKPDKAALLVTGNCLENYWPCASGPSVVHIVGAQLRDPINSGLIQWRLAAYYIDAVAESARNTVSKADSYGTEKSDRKPSSSDSRQVRSVFF